MISRTKSLLIIGMLVLGIQPLGSVYAASDADSELLDILLKKGTITQEEYDELKEASKDDVQVSTKGGHLKFSSADGEFKFQVGGRLMVDTARFFNTQGPNKLHSGTEIRRARLFMAGEVFNDWKFKNQIDFAGDGVSVKDAWLRYTGFKPTDITVGQFKEPFSLEELTSSKYITFMERALPNAFAPSRHIGAGVNYNGDNMTAAAGWFAGTTANQPDNSDGNQENGGAARLTYAPINDQEKHTLVHLGASAAYRTVSDDELQYRERPEAHIANHRLVDTGTMNDVDNVTQWGLEAATVLGPFSAQGEYISVAVDRNGESDPDFYGWYGYASWFLTGESRPYKHGVFGRVKPKSVVGEGGYGAWELAARLSKIDLEDSGVEGGEETDVTLGVNWYATSSIRFMLNYVDVINQKKGGTSDEPSLVEMRAQVDF
jgi:phosphate-selective porin OprO/OprP